ncbi:calcium uniporter regulatory subunit MCUb, mitochondrial-like [Electrophorus electricus]|uniref:Calcium uniporter regulatory subunit MCUb n=1 Tax=Electrophorus electricus TaxID=8005 RepID=A0A4W4FXL0_ELEEL|nr:calcium uniporter regulatory subunit MCUb, mitochondrial-like [Electrophorus electricus]
MACLRLVAELSGVHRWAHPIRAVFQTSARVHLKAQLAQLQWRCHPVTCCSTLSPSNDTSVQYRHGRPVLALTLPSRHETCLFFLRPMLTTVNDLLQDIHREDPGVTSASVLTPDGVKVASTTPMDRVLSTNFQLCINGVTYKIHSALAEAVSSERMLCTEDTMNMVHRLHAALYLHEHHLRQEQDLLRQLDVLKQELSPLEQMKAQLDARAERSSSQALWVGLALLSVQGGALAWLTWWVYSWDVMEPVTYFITYSTSIGVFAYYVLTKQDYVYPVAKDRQFLHYFYRKARREKFNVQQYNKLKDELASVEDNLRRLRNPNQLGLPVDQIHPRD